MFADNWKDLSTEQRREARMQAWMEPAGVEFVSAEAKLAYRERVQILKDAMALKRPARVPIAPWIGLLSARYGGLTAYEAYYEHDKLAAAWLQYHAEFDQDVLASSIDMAPCKLFDILDYKLYDWPRHGTPEDAGYQYNEAEWMKADEYDVLINDPSNFWQRYYLPRVFGAMEPWGALAPFTDLVELPMTSPFFVPFGTPPVRDMLCKILEAGRVAYDWSQSFEAMATRATATFGMPRLSGGATKAPFDILGDTLRGTRGLILDKFRRPEKVLEAVDRLVPLAIDWGVRAADANRHPCVVLPLHKGADGFLSDEDFLTFYWPTLKRVLLGLIDEGIVPICFAEGGYNERLRAIRDPEIPAGSMVWMFDATDMNEARRHLGGYQCFGGNVPGSLLTMGGPESVEKYVRQLIDDVAGDGGFILGTGIVLDEALPANVKAFITAGKRYGVRSSES